MPTDIKVTQHTPGPWTVYLGTRVVANVQHAGMHGALQDEVCDLRNGRDVEANARLIVAAPDLLDALKTTADNIRHLHSATSGQVYEAYSVWLRVVETAIAKAEGGAR